MKKLIFGIAVISLLASCSGKPQTAIIENDGNEDSVELATSQTSSASPDSVKMDTMNATSEDSQDKSALEQSARDFIYGMYAIVLKSSFYPVNNKYFTSDFVKIYNQTVKMESKRMSESDSDGGMDEEFFDDEFWSSYNDDPKSMGAKATINKVTVNENKKGSATATVIVKITPEGNQSPIKIDLVMTDNGWKINDYRGFKKNMQRYLKS